jgi:hypothetical protein
MKKTGKKPSAKRLRRVPLWPPLDFDTITPPTKRVRIAPKALEALEYELASALPLRYREFMERFGPGEYFRLVHIYALDKVRIDDFTSQAFIWANTDTILTPAQVRQVVVVGFGLNGDWVAFVKGAPERVLIFPHTDGPIIELPSFAHALCKYRPSDE